MTPDIRSIILLLVLIDRFIGRVVSMTVKNEMADSISGASTLKISQNG